MFTPIESLPSGIIGFEAHGQITRADSLEILSPRIDRAGRCGAKVKLLYVAAPDVDGYAHGGVFDDAVFGTRHFNAFERIAFVDQEGPYSRAVEAMAGLMPTAIKRFARDDLESAKAWISGR